MYLSKKKITLKPAFTISLFAQAVIYQMIIESRWASE